MLSSEKNEYKILTKTCRKSKRFFCQKTHLTKIEKKNIGRFFFVKVAHNQFNRTEAIIPDCKYHVIIEHAVKVRKWVCNIYFILRAHLCRWTDFDDVYCILYDVLLRKVFFGFALTPLPIYGSNFQKIIFGGVN